MSGNGNVGRDFVNHPPQTWHNGFFWNKIHTILTHNRYNHCNHSEKVNPYSANGCFFVNVLGDINTVRFFDVETVLK